MVRQALPRGRGSLPPRFCALLCGWACCLLALPALALGSEYEPPSIGSTEPTPELAACPSAPEASESEDPVVVELRDLRREQAASCAAVSARLDDARSRLWWIVSELVHTRELGPTEATAVASKELLQAVKGSLTAEGGQPVSFPEPVEVASSPGGLQVANPTDVTGVEAAVRDNSETFDSNAWAIFGVVAGFALLAFIWKLVRP